VFCVIFLSSLVVLHVVLVLGLDTQASAESVVAVGKVNTDISEPISDRSLELDRGVRPPIDGLRRGHAFHFQVLV
jgi:predicted secreted protein